VTIKGKKKDCRALTALRIRKRVTSLPEFNSVALLLTGFLKPVQKERGLCAKELLPFLYYE